MRQVLVLLSYMPGPTVTFMLPRTAIFSIKNWVSQAPFQIGWSKKD